MKSYDHIILGTGQSTGTLLGGLLPRGESIAIIEKEKIGGSCVNTGCTPTKTLVASARVAHVIKRAPEYGIYPAEATINYKEVVARMNRVRENSRKDLEGWISSEKQITLYKGRGYFEGKNTLRVGNEQINGRNIYINVGTRPRVPKITGIDSVGWLDNGGILELDHVPDHLVVVGGGYIGIEFSQIFRRFGSRVTMLVRGSQLMKNEDIDVAIGVQEILEDEGVTVLLESDIKSCYQTTEDEKVLIFDHKGEENEITCSHLLFAIGRIPNSDTINYGVAGLEADKNGYLLVDDYCKTNVEGVFALGDVNGHGSFTHTAVNDAEIVLDYLNGGGRKLSERIPVYALFCDPPLGKVGLSEKEAVAKGYKVLKATREMKRISRAKEMGETKGFAKLLVDAETDLILGASILGPAGDEIVNMFAAYMYSGLPCKKYRKSVLVHPTISELMPWVLDTLEPIN